MTRRASLLSRRNLLVGGGAVSAAALAAHGFLRHRPDKRFTVVVNQIPPILDFSQAGSSVNLLRPTLENMVETLLENDPNGGVRPGICNWVISDDARTIEYRVRPGVRFHSGDPLTAHDIEFSHERLLKGLPSYRSRCYDLARTEVLDDERIRFHFKTSGGTYLRTRGTYVYSKKYHDRVGEERFSKHPVGTGPYRLTRFMEAEYADLDAFEDYWGAPPSIKSVRIVYALEDMTRVAMLRAGEADLVMAVPFSMVPVLSELGFNRADADVHPTFSIRFQMVNPNTPWADLRVRRAIAHAVDSAAMIRGVFGGVPKQAAGFGPTEEGYDPTLKPFEYRPDLSRRLLAEAGYANGFKMPLVYFTNNYYGSRETAELVTLYLRKIGIDVETRAVDSAHALSFNREHARDPNAVLVTLGTAVFANYSDPVEAMRFSYGTRPPNSYYRSKEFDKLIERAILARDPQSRAEALKACMRQFRKDIPIVPLWNNVVVYMSRPGVEFTPTQHDVPLMRIKHARFA